MILTLHRRKTTGLGFGNGAEPSVRQDMTLRPLVFIGPGGSNVLVATARPAGFLPPLQAHFAFRAQKA